MLWLRNHSFTECPGMIHFSCFRLIFHILGSTFSLNRFGTIFFWYHKYNRLMQMPQNWTRRLSIWGKDKCQNSFSRGESGEKCDSSQIWPDNECSIICPSLFPRLSGMEASGDQVQLKGGGDFRGCGSTWKPPGSAVPGWWGCKLANQAPQTQTLRVQGPRERTVDKSGAAHGGIHRNVQVLLHWWLKVSELDLFRPCLC